MDSECMLQTQMRPARLGPHSLQPRGSSPGLSTLVAWLQGTHSHRPREPH